MQWFRSAKIGLGQSLQFPEALEEFWIVLLLWVEDSSSFQRKLVANEPRPFNASCIIRLVTVHMII